ncbi:MAG: methyltransferase domain-containing protein [Rhodospirillales bacterium]|jgi:SAM-dependent methyltransferase|nr:methyltransferase domain-containing protein [Rhodospirillales bacterium]
MTDREAFVDAAVRSLRELSAEPANAEKHVRVLQSMAPFPRQAQSSLLDRWTECFACGRSRASAVDHLAQGLGSHAQRVAILRLAARRMVEASWIEEAVRAFHHSCEPLGPAAFDPFPLRDKFAALSDDYDENFWSGETARQFHGFLEDSISFSPDWAALDAGCGTGLVGEWLAPRVARLDGIDLSADMLARARTKEIYDSLSEGDITGELEDPGRRGSYHLVVCNWCLFYIPDLSGFFRAAAGALMPGGRLALSVYPCLDDADVMRKEAETEFTHSRRYLRAKAHENALTEEQMEIRLSCAHPGFYAVFANRAS